ncbi:RsfA family transcriptional regulator [Lentibacillus juripiscarius]|uniref:RsfA family transcriptional regulator n=1 Tax=Lentibacillus juripiscarius TaxID=257446 RepID=A0ABW5V276_9BACI
MAKVRQDAWSHEDDLLLAETVLRHIREGSTQLNAFEEVGDKLNRTSAACGFRWNAEVRNKYTDAIELAKRQRKEKKRANATKAKEPIMHVSQTNEQSSEELLGLDETIPVSGGVVPASRETMPVSGEAVPASGETMPVSGEAVPAENTEAGQTMTMDTVIQFLKQVKKDYHASNQSKESAKKLEEENKMLREEVSGLKEQLSESKKQLESLKEDYQVFMQIMDRARKMTVLDDQGSFQAPSFRMDKNGNLQQVADGSGNQ